MNRQQPGQIVGLLLFTILLQSCGGGSTVQPTQTDGAPGAPRDISNVPDAVPKNEPRSRYGNPESYVVFGKRYYVMASSRDHVERGIASWYGTKFHGKRTSSGESYDMYAMTAAHKSLPLPTYVQVRNLENGRTVIVKVNDRGPFHENRIIDMSYAAASKLGMLAKGTALVEVRALEAGEKPASSPRYVATSTNSQPAATSSKPLTTAEEFYIQVGAFSELDNAERLRLKLDNIENKFARIYQTVVDNNTLYRVRIGPLADVDTADRIVARLPDYGLSGHHIVVE